MNLKKTFKLLIMSLLPIGSFGQLQVEAVIGHHNYRYQQNYNTKFLKNNWGFSHVSSLLELYSADAKTEIMTQSYITYNLYPAVKIGMGTYYASKPGFSPSVNLQFIKKGKNYSFIITPRIDLTWHPAWDVLAAVEFRPKLNANNNYYFRIQTLDNFTGTKHNRSYQYIKLGLERKRMLFGIAADFDAYGSHLNYAQNFGVFLISVL